MKEQTRNYLVIAALFVAVFALVTAKNLKIQKQIEGLADDSVIGQGKPVLLELGSHGCIPCQKMMPILEDLSKTQESFTVSFIDVDIKTDAWETYDMKLKPTQIFFDAQGKELFRHTGFYGKEEILAKWKELTPDD